MSVDEAWEELQSLVSSKGGRYLSPTYPTGEFDSTSFCSFRVVRRIERGVKHSFIDLRFFDRICIFKNKLEDERWAKEDEESGGDA